MLICEEYMDTLVFQDIIILIFSLESKCEGYIDYLSIMSLKYSGCVYSLLVVDGIIIGYS